MKKLLLFTIVLCVVTQGQSGQTKPDPKPITLSAEASAQWIEAQRQINELNSQIKIQQLQQQVLAARAQVPDGYTIAGLDSERRVVYAPPAKPETAKAGPEKKD